MLAKQQFKKVQVFSNYFSFETVFDKKRSAKYNQLSQRKLKVGMQIRSTEDRNISAQIMSNRSKQRTEWTRRSDIALYKLQCFEVPKT